MEVAGAPGGIAIRADRDERQRHKSGEGGSAHGRIGTGAAWGGTGHVPVSSHGRPGLLVKDRSPRAEYGFPGRAAYRATAQRNGLRHRLHHRYAARGTGSDRRPRTLAALPGRRLHDGQADARWRQDRRAFELYHPTPYRECRISPELEAPIAVGSKYAAFAAYGVRRRNF